MLHGKAWEQGKAWLGMGRYGKEWQGMARQGKSENHIQNEAFPDAVHFMINVALNISNHDE